MKHILILGAGYAGMMASLRLSQTTRKHSDVQVTLINATEYFVERIRLHEVAAGHPPEPHRIEKLLEDTGVQFLHARVTAIQPDRKTLQVLSANGSQELNYDKMVYALGSRIAKDTIPGAAQYAYRLNQDSASDLQLRLKSLHRGGRVVIIGGGLTGIEGATEIAESYPDLQVTLMSNGKLGDDLSRKAQDYLYKIFEEMKIEVIENARVERIEPDHVVTEDGQIESADVVLWSAGFTVPELAKQSGFAVDKSGRIIVDAYLRSISYPDVYAAGDAMTYMEHAPLKNRMSCQSAMPSGAHVGDNLATWVCGTEEKAFAFGYRTQCISLGQKRGLVQMVHADEGMKEQIITGRPGAFVKRLIVNGTIWTIQMERHIKVPAYSKAIQIQDTPAGIAISEH